MLQQQKYYQHSGAIGITGFLSTLILGSLGALLLAAVYAYAIFYIPFIYINFFITLAFGAGIGFAVGYGGKFGKVRNTKFMTLCGLILGMIAVYASWVVWLFALTEHEYLLLDPQQVLAFIQLIALEGAWEIFGWTPKGWALYSIWIIEALMVIGVATYMARNFLISTPFCDPCNQWIEDEEIISPLTAVTDTYAFTNSLEAGDLNPIYELQKQVPRPSQYSVVHILKCPGCSQYHYFTLIDVLLDNSGDEEKTVETPIIENLLINPEHYHAMKGYWNNNDAPEGIEAFQSPG